MNQHTPYELTIAQKLQQFPLPDMADAIWARVERQLDIDLPTNDDGGNPPSSPSGSGWIGGAAVGLFVGAFVLVFLLFKRENPITPPALREQNTPINSLPADRPTNIDKRPEKNTTDFRPPASTPSPSPDVPVPQARRLDSAVSILPSPQADTQQTTSALPPRQRTVQDSAPPRRLRGVTGITDDDYRIVPTRKDSL